MAADARDARLVGVAEGHGADARDARRGFRAKGHGG